MARILNVSPDEYHRLPGLSSSTAKVLLERSPLHARARAGRPPSKLLDRGTILHRLTLGKGKEYCAIDAKDWRTKAAKEARDDARSRDLVPVLADELVEHEDTAGEIRAALAARGLALDGDSELAVEWSEGAVACKSMFDHVWLGNGVILDLKITENAAPTFVERNAENLGYAIQSAAYSRALAQLMPEHAGRVEFLFAFCEADKPFAINVCRPDGVFREVGERRWLRAVRTWAACLASDKWPAYGDGINQLSTPPWALAREGYDL